MSDVAELKKLLAAAEAQIVHLQEEKQSLDDFMNGLMEQQKMEAEEMVRLTEQVWKLEALLEDVSLERDDVRLLLQGLCSDMEKIRDVAADTLKAASKDKDSILKMAVKFYDVKTLADSVTFLKDK